MAITAYIGFGSNQGDLTTNLKNALNHLTLDPAITVQRISPLYKTEPLTCDAKQQPWYLNGVIEICTTLSLHRLLECLKNTEKILGRLKTQKWQPRIADLDILLYGNAIYQDNEITVPHPQMTLRRFVMQPLCDLVPDLVHPALNMTIKEILDCLQDSLEVKAFAPNSQPPCL